MSVPAAGPLSAQRYATEGFDGAKRSVSAAVGAAADFHAPGSLLAVARGVAVAAGWLAPPDATPAPAQADSPNATSSVSAALDVAEIRDPATRLMAAAVPFIAPMARPALASFYAIVTSGRPDIHT